MAETITSEVVGKVAVPAGAPSGAAAPGKGYSAVSSKPFHACDPQIQALVRAVLSLYEAAPFDAASGRAVLANFVPNATWDTPLVFARGAERIRALARLIALPFSRVVATPRIVTVSMLNESVGRVDVEGVLEFEARGARAWPLSLVAPARLPVHSSWCITARGEDDKVLSVTERLHNVPPPPYLLRALAATFVSTGAIAVGAV